MRRRPRTSVSSGVPENLANFTPEEWPGKSDYQQWRAWDEARRSWAIKNLPGGEDDLPDWIGAVPDQPWSEAKLLL